MRPPAFWARDGWEARLLAPLGAVTAALTARRVARPGFTAPVPVFCCGNASLGGAGKTTLALELGRMLAGRGPLHFLTRGHGGRLRGPLRVDPARHTAADVGDEPLLLAGCAPTWIGADRAVSARAAVAAGARVLVMDDGLQNPSLAGRRNILVVDGAVGFGNGRLVPAGPLREAPERAAARCAAVVLIGPDEAGALARLPPALPLFRADLVPDGLEALDGRPAYAFAGIARPEKFFGGLRAAGVRLAGSAPFPDHHRFTARDLARVLAAAAAAGAVPVTTPKDGVRLPQQVRAQVLVLGVRLRWHDPAAVAAWLGS